MPTEAANQTPENTPAAATSPAASDATADALNVAIKSLTATAGVVEKGLTILANTPAAGVTPGQMFGGQAPFGTSGSLREKGFSYLKMAGYAMGAVSPEDAKEELDVCSRLQKSLVSAGFTPTHPRFAYTVPFSTEHLPHWVDGVPELAAEIRQKSFAAVRDADPDEMNYIAQKAFHGRMREKAMGTLSDILGGSLVAGPSLGELIELQRNAEIFSRLGCRELTLPPNGRIQFPKQTSGGTFYMVGEGKAITESSQATGSLTLSAKKGACLTVLNDELIRFASPAAEQFVRADIAAVAARGWDTQMLTGVGGMTNILGLLRYTDLTSHTGYETPVDANTGYVFQPEDASLMEAELPDAVDQPTAWLMRKTLWGKLRTRRNAAVSPGDNKGAFTFDAGRIEGSKAAYMLEGTPVVRSNNVPADRTRGSGTALTLAILGLWSEWIIGRMGAMEFLSNAYSDTYFVNAQVGLRMIQYQDAGARHGASFNLFDGLQVA